MSNHRRHLKEERRPCGIAGGLGWQYWSRYLDRQAPDISDCLVSRPKPWILVIWEPIKTLAPSPARCSPHCCYANSVIFYARPHVKREWHKIWRSRSGQLHADKPGAFETYDQVETRFNWDDVVTFEGDRFEIGGGHVEWARKRWWMCRGARRRRAE
jgi:hypothetical protein